MERYELNADDCSDNCMARMTQAEDGLWVLESAHRHKIATAIGRSRLQSAKDVCMYCAAHAVGYEPAEGPNIAGNWTHKAQARAGGKERLCAASAIYARIRYEAAALKGSDEKGK